MEGGKLFIVLTKVVLADIVFEIISSCHPAEVARGIVKPFLGSHLWYVFMCNAKDLTTDIVSYVGCFMENIWRVSTVILPSFKNKSIKENPAGVVEFLADNIY